MTTIILQVIVILLLPGALLIGKKYIRPIEWMGTIAVCFLLGIIAGNMPFLTLNKPVMKQAAEISVCLAIPMLFFTCDFRRWLKHARSIFLSFFLACLAVIIVTTLFYFILNNKINEAWKVAGMLMGVYTGGTPNMSAIGIALEAEEGVFVLMNSADLLLAGIYYLFLLTLGKKVFGLILPRFKGFNGNQSKDQPAENGFNGLPAGEKMINILISFGLSILCFAAAVGVSSLITGKTDGSVIILILTTLGISFSFIPRIRRLKGNYETGDYLLLVFALAIGSMADFSQMATLNLYIVMYVGIVVFGSALLHVLSSAFFKLDDDTVIITSVAAIFGPAFVAPVGERIKNRDLIIPGISLALLANAFGNYLGISAALLLHQVK
ncbi:MAG TPA: DUF819 family protein [Bacteroidales bacterium]|nr:DUF819 family protein [Bacteroidales bacterium]